MRSIRRMFVPNRRSRLGVGRHRSRRHHAFARKPMFKVSPTIQGPCKVVCPCRKSAPLAPMSVQPRILSTTMGTSFRAALAPDIWPLPSEPPTIVPGSVAPAPL